MTTKTVLGQWHPDLGKTGVARRLVVGSAIVALVLCTIKPVDAARGYRDVTFGRKGRVTTDFDGRFSQASMAAIQSDGKVVAIGNSNDVLALARYNEDGSPDTGFGKGGTVRAAVWTFSAGISVAIQPDGKIVAAGIAYTPDGGEFALLRYNPDGSLDPGFGVGGAVITDFFGGSDGIESILIMPDGRILAGGFAVTSRNISVVGLARYDSSGGLDRSFGDSGKTTFDFIGLDDYAKALTLQTDGKIIVGASVTKNTTGICGVARLNDDGSLDSSFGAGGKVTTDFINLFQTLALQLDGKIIAAGLGGYFDPVAASLAGFGLVRFNPDGSLDTEFGDVGKVVTVFSARGGDWVVALSVQPGGRILAAGPSWIPDTSNFNFVVVGYNPNGTLDSGFGAGGKLTDSFFTKQSFIAGVAFQANGKVVAVGQTGKYSHGHSSFAVVRYSLDPNSRL